MNKVCNKGSFKKGIVPWNKGLTKESDVRVRGPQHSEETKKRISLAKKGVKFSEEHKNSLSLAKKGKGQPWRRGKSWGSHGWEAKMRIAEYQRGKTRSEATKIKMSLSKIGQKSFLGKKHSEDTKKRMSLLKAIKVQNIKGDVGPYKGHMFRSNWELLAAKKMDGVGMKWEYEPKYFILSNGHTYTPDFKTEFGWLEIKGFFLNIRTIRRLNMFVAEGNELFIIDERNINNPELYDAIPWGGF
jgi:hypothetical protein